MSEPTNVNIPTDRPVNLRKLRHSIQKHTYLAAVATAGQPGLAKADQMIRADKCIEELETALAKAKVMRDLVASRDFDAHQNEKAAKQATHEALPAGEAAQEKLTFQQIIEELEGKAPGTTKPEDNPPF